MLHTLRRIRLFGALVFVATGLLSATAATSAEKVKNAALEHVLAGESPQGIAELIAFEEHLQALAKQVRPAVVGVRVGPAQGSGVIISEDGYVLTAAHVVGRPNVDVVFVLHDGRQVRGKTLGMNRTIDAGLMKISGDEKWPHAEMGDVKELDEGDWCMAMGHPGGYEKGRQPVVRFGRILEKLDDTLVTDCTLVGGDSGGPLFDLDGRVIGINSRIAGPLNANMHVPVDTFRDTWDRLAKAEAWGNVPGTSSYMGVQGEPNNDSPLVHRVVPDSPAERAGFKSGDLVLKFDGREVRTFRELSNNVAERSPGERVKVEIKRGDRIIELDVIIGRREG